MYIQFAELPVFDQERAKKFYIDHLHFCVAADQAMDPDGWRWIELRPDESPTALHFVRRKDDVPSEMPVLVLVARDVEATVRALKASGVKILQQAQEPPWQPGRLVAAFQDSEGNHVAIGSPPVRPDRFLADF